MVCVGLSVIVPVAFLLFTVCMCSGCDWLCVVVWRGYVCVFFLTCVCCVSSVFLWLFVCVRFVCGVLCVVAWFLCLL